MVNETRQRSEIESSDSSDTTDPYDTAIDRPVQESDTLIDEDPVGDEVTPRVPVKVIGIGAGIGVALIVILLAGGLGSAPPTTVPATAPPTIVTSDTPPPGTLGVTFEDFRDEWNKIELKPYITSDLRRIPEAGPFDSFSYKFDASAVVAGAYDPDSDYLVGLMVRSSIEHPSIANMYLHVCFVVDPYSQDCIDNYLERGLGGAKIKKLGKLSAHEHEASWDYQGYHWQVEVVNNIQTIRVAASDAD